MARFVSFLLIAFFAAVTFAAPAPHNSLQKRSFQAHAPGRGHRSGYQDIVRTHNKYGWEIIVAGDSSDVNAADSVPAPAYSARSSKPSVTSGPQIVTRTVFVTASAPSSSPIGSIPTFAEPGISTSSSTRVVSESRAPTATTGNEDGEVTATPEENESEYLSPVTVGGQELNLNFDTGSADLWVFSTLLSSSSVRGHSVFDPDNSSTFEAYEGATWRIRYGDGSGASGTVGFDVVDVGGTTVQKQCVELANQVSASFTQDEVSDGLLGLGFSSISTVQPEQQKTFFENVMSQLTSPVFTADLEETDGTGTYEFGRIDDSKYHGEIHYTPIDNSDGWWQFQSPTYTIDGKESACTVCSPAIADTGTSLVYMDADIAKAYWDSTSSGTLSMEQGGYIYDCSESLPSFGLAVGEYMATINGTDMGYSPLDDGTGMCYGGLQSAEGQGVQIIGDVFLKQFFAVFDGGEMRFGVALKN